MNRLTRRIVFGALAVLFGPAGAQTPYPAKPIRLVVPTVAGGPSDAAARVLAKGMAAGLGQEVVVENRPGANNGLGAAAVLTEAPDGYTLFFALVANAGLPYLSKTSPYKSLSEFSPIAAIGGNTLCLVVPSSIQVKTLAAFAAHAKASSKPLLRGANTPADDMLAGQITSALGIPPQGIRELMRVIRPGGTIAAYHWDLAGGGLPLQPIIDAARAEGYELQRPPSAWAATVEASEALWLNAGSLEVQTRQFEVSRIFDSFDGFWRTAYSNPRLRDLFASLSPAALQRLNGRVREQLGVAEGGPLVLKARANAVKGRKR